MLFLECSEERSPFLLENVTLKKEDRKKDIFFRRITNEEWNFGFRRVNLAQLEKTILEVIEMPENKYKKALLRVVFEHYDYEGKNFGLFLGFMIYLPGTK